jgi:tRNA A22 N-methylase
MGLKRYRDVTEEGLFAGFGGLLVAIIIFVIMALFSVGYLVLRPALNNLWLKGHRTTNEYVTTKETVLFKYKASYERLDVEIAKSEDPGVITAYRGQQKAMLEQMIYDASMLNEAGAEVPSAITTFIDQEKQEHQIP